jgi:hypothetical protein
MRLVHVFFGQRLSRVGPTEFAALWDSSPLTVTVHENRAAQGATMADRVSAELGPGIPNPWVGLIENE